MLGGLVAAIVIVMIALFWQYTQDDVFITYVYSRNIAEGVGFVFNPGEQVQGSTTPLYALLMAGVYFITTDLLHAGNALGGVWLLLTCLVVWHLLRDDTGLFARAAYCLLLVSSPLVYVSLGMETLFYGLLLVTGLLLYAKGQHVASLLAAAALTWTRADGVVLAGTLGLLMLWEARHSRAMLLRTVRNGMIYAAAIAPWFLFAWWYFGTPLPNTFSAKVETLSGTGFLDDMLSFTESFYGNNPLMWLVFALALPGFIIAWRNPKWRAVALWILLYITGYTILNVTNFWYYTPLLTALLILSALGLDRITRRVAQSIPGPTVQYLAAGGLLAASVVPGLLRAADFGPPPPRVNTYINAGRWIQQHTPPDSTLLVADLGIVGYYAERYTLDSFGLIVPEMHYKTITYAMLKYKTDYVLATQFLDWPRITQREWFRELYLPVMQISEPDDFLFSPMTVYRRITPPAPPNEMVSGFDLALSCTVDLPVDAPLPQATDARIMDATGQVIIERERDFLWGLYPGSTTPAPETLIEQIVIPLTVPPGTYTWELTCHDETQNGSVTVIEPAAVADYVEVVATWPEAGTLRGILLPDGAQTWSGAALRVALDFEASEQPQDDLSVFVHLLDANGALVAQSDGLLRDDMRPSQTWEPGENIVDVRHIDLPPDLPAGEYTLLTGWYNWRTGERTLTTAGDDSVQLPVTVVNRFPGGSGLP